MYLRIRKEFTMEKYDLKPYYITFKIAVYMAEERYKEYEVEFAKEDTDGDGIVGHRVDLDYFEKRAKRSEVRKRELSEFLNSLDYEVIKALQVIMYIGKDSNYMESDGTYNYEKTRKCFDHEGWADDKSIEVSQMVEKLPLDKYLKDGFEKLGIVL